MKLVIYIAAILLIAIDLQTQAQGIIEKSDYPRFVTDTATGMRCVVFTLEQAKKLDNDEELLKIYQLLHSSSDSLIKSLIFKVSVSDTEIAYLQLKVTELEKVNATQKSLISILNEQIADYKQNVALADKQLTLKDEQIKNLNKEVKRQKRLKILGFSVGGAGIIVALMALL